jgi:hypothetical protein
MYGMRKQNNFSGKKTMKFERRFYVVIIMCIFSSLFFILYVGCSESEEGQPEDLQDKNADKLNDVKNPTNIIDEPDNQNLVNTINGPVDQYIIVKNQNYIDYEYEFEKLSKDEVLSYSYGKYVINDENVTYRLSVKNTRTDQERILECGLG